MTNTLSISHELFNGIISHCKETYPNEACGLLAGKMNIIKRIYKITNIRHSKIDYEMDPKEQLKCEKEIKASGLKVIGIYHSHPSMQAYPSQTDVMRAYWPGDPDMPIYPDIGYMIIGPVDDDIKVRVFKINSGQKVDEINLNII